MHRLRLLVDVDGVVLDLMGGFSRYLFMGGDDPMKGVPAAARPFDRSEVTRHKLGRCPGLEGHWPAFVEFMRSEDPYRWTLPHRDAIDSLGRIAERHEVVFTTATMSQAPTSYASKFERLRDLGMPYEVCSIPSELKRHFRGDIGIDDRADICLGYVAAGTPSICFVRPWSYDGRFDAQGLKDAGIGLAADPEDGHLLTSEAKNPEESAWSGVVSMLERLELL